MVLVRVVEDESDGEQTSTNLEHALEIRTSGPSEGVSGPPRCRAYGVGMTTKGGRRGPYTKSAERRQRIIDAAFEVFAARGYHAGSFREIADLAGMSQTSLLHYFPTKRHLLVAVLDLRDVRDHIKPPTPLPRDFPASLVERARLNEDVPNLVELYTVLCGEAMTEDHPARDYFIHRFDRIRAEFAAKLRELRDAGRLRDGVDIDRAAASIIALWDGIQAQWLLEPSVDVAGCLADYLALLIRPAGAAELRHGS